MYRILDLREGGYLDNHIMMVSRQDFLKTKSFKLFDTVEEAEKGLEHYIRFKRNICRLSLIREYFQIVEALDV